jgi:multidrug transporter EmrE-like cation transporter
MFSSIIFSTYYTTEFLKHDPTKRFHPEEKTHSPVVARQFHILPGAVVKPKLSTTVSNEAGKKTGYGLEFFTSFLYNMSRPQLLTLYRFSGSLLLGIFLHGDFMNWNKRLAHTISYMQDFSLPAIFLFTANYCNSVALDRIGISLAYTSKCLIPLITVAFTLLLDGIVALPPNLALLMLLPIAAGVALASWKSPTFEKYGFLAALVSSTAQAALNVSSKRALVKTGISGLEAQRSMAAVAFLLAIGMTVQSFMVGANRKQDQYLLEKGNTSQEQQQQLKRALPPLGLSIAAAASYHFEYVLSFLFLKMVQPIGYGTCDAIRRLGIILAGRVFFGGEPFSLLNYAGIGMALLGAMGYSLVSSGARG